MINLILIHPCVQYLKTNDNLVNVITNNEVLIIWKRLPSSQSVQISLFSYKMDLTFMDLKTDSLTQQLHLCIQIGVLSKEYLL